MAANPYDQFDAAGGKNPYDVFDGPPAQPRGYVASALSGVPESLWGTWAKGLSLAAAAPAIGIDKLRGMVTGREETGAQDWAFRNLTDTATEKAQQYALTPEEASNPGKVFLHGLGGMLPTLAAAVATRGAIGGKELAAQTAAMLPRAAPWALNAAEGAAMMAPAAAVTGASSAATKVEQGTDLPTAYKTGAIDAAGTMLQGALPLSVAGGLATRVASGAGIGVATGELQREAQNAVLGNRPDLQRGVNAQDMAINAATGALFAGILGPRPAKQEVQAAKAETQTDLDRTDSNLPSEPPASSAPPASSLALPFNPLAGTPIVFPDGTVALGSEAAAAKRGGFAEALQPGAEPPMLGYTPRLGDVPAVFPDGTVALNRDQIAAKPLMDRYAEKDRAGIARTQATIEALRAERAAAEAVTNLPGTIPLPPAELPPLTAMEFAMQRAQRTAGFGQAEREAAASKQTDLDRLQNVAQAERESTVAERGETPAGTVQAALPHGMFLDTYEAMLAQAKQENPSAARPRGLAQDVTQAVRGAKTLPEQVAALDRLYQDSLKKNPQSERTEYLGRMLDQFTDLVEPIPEAKAPDETPSTQAPEALAPAAQGEAPTSAALRPGPAGTAADVAPQAAGVTAAPAIASGEPRFVAAQVEDSRGNPSLGLRAEFATSRSTTGVVDLAEKDGRLFPVWVDNGGVQHGTGGMVTDVYEKAIAEAQRRGLQFTSDDSVTATAARVYSSLQKRGYTVEKNPAARLAQPPEVASARWMTDDGSPVFVVKPTNDPVQNAIEVLKAAYGNETDAMQAVRRIQDRANGASPTGRADPEVMIQMALEDAQHQASKRAEGAELPAEPASPRNAALHPEREAALNEVREARASMQALADEYAQRLHAREEMPESEHERYARAAELQQSLQDALNPNGHANTPEFLRDLAGFAKDYATPEAWEKAKGDWLASRPENPDRISRALLMLTDQPRPISDILTHLEDNGSEPWVRELAGKLRGFDLKTIVDSGKMPDGLPQGTVAGYNTKTDQMRITDYGATESTVLHEAVHAATAHVIEQAEAIQTPANQSEAVIKRAYDGLEQIRKEALRRASPKEQYGLTNIDEFMAELHTNPGFQQFLGEKGLWQRVVDGVRKLLGLPVESRTALERAMDLQKDLFNVRAYEAVQQARQEAKAFDASYKGAAETTDQVLAKVVQQADEDSRWVNFGRATARAVAKAVMGWQTKQYIMDRTAAIPEFRAAGLADAVRAMYDTDQSRIDATRYAQTAATQFAGNLHAALREITDPAERKKANDMMGRVGVGASIGGFDPWQNFKDNLKDHPNLDPRSEGHINQTYRDFVALQRAYPKLAEATIEGAKVNRSGYINDVATLVDGLLKHAIGGQTKLEAELNRMEPAQAAIERARMGRTTSSDPDLALANFYAGKLDFMAKDVQTASNPDTKRFADGASAELNRRLTEVFQQAAALPKDSLLRQQLGEMQRAYEQQIVNAYYHAGRDGEYFANIGFRNMDDATWAKMNAAIEGGDHALGDYTNQDHIFAKFDTPEEAAAFRRKLTDAGGDKIDMSRVRSGKWATEGRLDSNSGISSALRSVLDTLQDSVSGLGLDAEQSAALRDVVSRRVLSLLPETSVKTAQLHRMGVPGYDTDFLGTFAQHAAASTRDTANLYTMRTYANAINAMTDSVAKLSESPDIDMASRGQDIRDEMLKRYNNSMKPVDSSAVNLINSLGHAFYLALAPAFFIRTMAQPYHRGLPYLGSRYGFVDSAKEIAGATGTAMKIVANSMRAGWQADGMNGVLEAGLKFDNLGLTSHEQRALQEMQDRGVLNLGQITQLQKMRIDGSQAVQSAVRMASLTAQYAEMTNRIATGLAAFRLAEKTEPSPADATSMAHMNYMDRAVKYVMDDFSPDNTARAIGKHGIAGPVTPLMTAFMNYNLQTMQQIARTVHDGMFSHDQSPEGQQRAAEARREFAGLMGTSSMIAGALGLPFAGVFAGVYNTLTNDDANPHDIRVDARNWLKDNLGAGIGEAVAHGPLQALTGIDTSTFGLQNLLPGTDFLASRRLLKDRLDELPKTLMGPALNAGLDLAAAAVKITDGQYVKGIEQLLPTGLKGYWKAGELATRGYTDARGNPVNLPVTPWDIAVQATGLRPADKAEMVEANNAMTAAQERINHRKSLINDDIYKAYRFSNPDAMQGALSDMAEFNRKNPVQAIRDVPGMIRSRVLQEALGASTGGVNVPSKRLLPTYAEQTRFDRGGGMP